MTPDVLHVKCPQCGAEPGQKCKNYLGKGCAPHRLRQKLGDPQGQLMKKAVLREGRERDKREKAAESVPLFAEEVLQDPVKTAAENYWQLRADGAKGHGAQEPYVGFFEDWQTILLKALAQRVLPAEVYAMSLALFTGWLASCPEERWTDLLTSRKKIVLKRYRHVFGCELATGDPRYYDGPPFWVEKRVEVGDMVTWPPDDWQPPLTREQVKEFLETPPPEQPDDGGLAALLDQVIERSRRQA